ncbi:MAG TPA: DEAD/DEAH box helicase [Candidatus Polarisedimenticolia bacterium]|nr:DEAD/DEAH box helicase [Candidatus Polarisedimenticolia bacterium]
MNQPSAPPGHPSVVTFGQLSLDPRLKAGIDAAGYVECTPIQAQVIPPALQGRDITGMAQTGTGKTAAFLVPILQMLKPSGEVQALIVTPTRELAIQVCGEAEKLGRFMDVKAAAIYGGTSIGHQRREIFGGVDIVVGTPGRLIDFVKSAVLRMRYIRWLVLDEADRMLDMGFIDDIDFLCRRAPLSRQTLLFSATLPPPIVTIAHSYMMHPLEVKVSRVNIVAEGVTQSIHKVTEDGKMPLLLSILKAENPERCLIFTARRESTGEIMRKLREKGFEAARLSSLQEQRHREGIMEMFRKGEVHILVATDVAGRGIDIGSITHVINYDIPMEADDYVHRVGRTARAGRRGHAITFVTSRDMKRLAEIRSLTGLPLPIESPDGAPVAEDEEAEGGSPRRRRGRRSSRAGGSASGGGHHGEGHAPGGQAQESAAAPGSGAGSGAGKRRRRRGGRGKRGGRGQGGSEARRRP